MSSVTGKDKRRELLRAYTVPKFYDVDQHSGSVVPKATLQLANLPTPIQRWSLPELPEDVAIDVKRDDYTGGIEMTGNKVRKLEFILGDAVDRGVDTIFSAGGTQSNHARATAACCARLQIPCHLYLRKDSEGHNGNFLLDQLLGATIHEITREQQNAWLAETEDWVERRAEEYGAANQVVSIGVPIGGSNALGAWGYVNCVNELANQLEWNIEATYSDIVACTGSGGTLAGLGVGTELYRGYRKIEKSALRLRSYGVSDSPQYFYDYINGLTTKIYKGASSREIIDLHDAKGLGYAKSTTEELQFISRVARETGLILDFCYTGKTVFGLWKDVVNGGLRPSKRILYIHTGGGPSIFDRADLFQTVF